MATWLFKRYFRSGAYGWQGSTLAAKRLREAISEIKAAAKTEPVQAGEGVVALCERLWPAFQHIDTSSGSLGSAINRTLSALLPFLISAPADIKTRRKWLERLETAIEDDGVDYLCQVRQVWGKVCAYTALANEWADELVPLVRQIKADQNPGSYSNQTVMCLSCLLETGRYGELEELLTSAPHLFWHEQEYWAEALGRQGEIDKAIKYAESCRHPHEYYETEINEFCEKLLLNAGRWEEAYRRYGLSIRHGHTYIAQYKAITAKYPQLDSKQILHDLIAASSNAGDWFAAARSAGHLDIALECALAGTPNPGTLATAARDTVASAPEFAFTVALRALHLFIDGYGYENPWPDALRATDAIIGASRALGNPASCFTQMKSVISRIKDDREPLAEMLRRHLKNNWPELRSSGDQLR